MSAEGSLILGIGNVLRGDDGAGVWLARLLAGLDLPPEVEVADGGIAAVRLGGLLTERRFTVVVDAAEGSGVVGRVRRYRPEQVQPWAEPGDGLHRHHLLHVIEENKLLGLSPGPVVVLTVSVQDLAWRLGLSPPLVGALTELARQALGEVGLDPPRGVDFPALYEAALSSWAAGPFSG